MIPLQEMKRRVLGSVDRGPTGTSGLDTADGSVTAVDITSPSDYPLFDNSAMDGFALRSADVPAPGTSLRVRGVSSAGHPFEGEIGPGEAVRILTGAMMVDGADCVVAVEVTRSDGDRVVIDTVPRPGAHVRNRGEIVVAGDVVVPAGTRLNPAHLGLLASLGVDRVEVVEAPRIVILSTGDELVAPGGTPEPGQIFESNTILLRTLLARMKCAVDVVEAVDDAEMLASLLADLGARYDVIISTGGVSMGGDYDALRNAAVRFDVDVVQVAIKPAKPFAFGRVGDAIMFGLPGNPASVLVSFESFVRPALRTMSGMHPAELEPVRGELAETIARPDDGKVHFLAMARDDSGQWAVTARHGSHAISPFADAEAILAIGPERSHVPAGTEVDLIPLWT